MRGTDNLTVNTFNIIVPVNTPTDSNPQPPDLNVNVPPVTGGSNTLSLLESETVTLDHTMLDATDTDNTAAELVYRVHSLPTSGSVRLNGMALLVNQTFTQEDVNDGRVSFAHAGDEDFIDAFTYTVSDGKNQNSLRPKHSTLPPRRKTIRRPPPYPAQASSLLEGRSFALTIQPSLLALTPTTRRPTMKPAMPSIRRSVSRSPAMWRMAR